MKQVINDRTSPPKADFSSFKITVQYFSLCDYGAEFHSFCKLFIIPEQ